jgi:biopolymer transport protein ExbB/TolQ
MTDDLTPALDVFDVAPATAPAPIAPGARLGGSTEVSLPVSAAWGAALCAAFYLLIGLLFRERFIGHIFMDRGWVTVVEAYVASWAACFMVLKTRQVYVQQQLSKLEIFPREQLPLSDPKNLDRMTTHIDDLASALGAGLLFRRVRQAFLHFRLHPSRAAVSELLTTMADVDSSRTDTSYTMLHVMIWAIPIVGFIGTVVGLGGAVGGFSASLPKATDFGELKQLLAGVTSGLSVAFDATFVALLISLLLMFPASAIEKYEQNLLSSIDEFCHREIIGRITDAEATAHGGGVSAKEIRELLEQSLKHQQEEFLEWWKAAQIEVARTMKASAMHVAETSKTICMSAERVVAAVDQTSQMAKNISTSLSQGAGYAGNIAEGLSMSRGETQTMVLAIKTASENAQGIATSYQSARVHADACKTAAGEIEQHLARAREASAALQGDVVKALHATEANYHASVQLHVGEMRQKATAAVEHMQALAEAFTNFRMSGNGKEA